ncbi:MAG: acyl-CoA/acyl-ACP dehydrogenase [Nocardioidaceae bacterium]|nr:acyl-CoA/acyl-ACP dehydrogenase [Nocardioidaceae bacterium]MCL2612997.1 acyl-CoA/acyl-ACP dehydrogenase [Nocardioidaceae bacterium]
MSELNLLPTPDEDDLRSTVAGFLAKRCDTAAIRDMYDGDRSAAGPVWRGLAGELGLAALLVPEELGGAGASAREAAVVLEQVGGSVAPAPFLTSAVVATTVLLAADATDAARDLLRGLAAGERTAALAVPFSAGSGGAVPTMAAEGDRVSGQATSVAGALEADVLLVPVAADGGVAVLAVRAADATVVPVESLDMSRQLADLSLEGAAGEVVVPAGAGAAAIDRALLTGAGLLASEQVGVAAWCLLTTVAYLKERRQFGRVVGGFQALKHRLADLYVAVESANAAARYAAAALAADDADAELAVHLAASYCGDAAVQAAEEAVQLHGGIGMTWEHPAHLYLKRAKSAQIALGAAGAHRDAIGRLVDLPAPD